MELFGPIPDRNYNYLPRKHENQLKAAVDNAAITFINGPEKIGKTELILQYIQNNQAQYETIYWFSCDTQVKFMNSMRQIAKDLKLMSDHEAAKDEQKFQEDIQSQLKAFFKSHQKWLIILDGLSNIEDLTFIPQWPKGKIIISTGLPTIPGNLPTPLTVEKLNIEEAKNWLENVLQTNDTQDPKFTQHIATLLKKTDAMPGRFVSLVRLMQNLKQPLAEFAALLAANDYTQLDQFRIHNIQVEAANNQKQIASDAWLLLQACAYVATYPLTFSFIETIYTGITTEFKKAMPSKVNEVIDYLCHHTLLTLSRTNYLLENEIKLFVINKHLKDQNFIFLKSLLSNIGQKFLLRRSNNNQSPPDEGMLKHTESLCDIIWDNRQSLLAEMSKNLELLTAFIDLSNSLGLFYKSKNRFQLALSYLERAKQLVDEAHFPFITNLLSDNKAEIKSARDEINQNIRKLTLVQLVGQELLHNLGNIRLNYFEYKMEALEHIVQVLAASLKLQRNVHKQEKLDNDSLAQFTQRTLIRAYRDLAKIAIQNKKYDEAQTWLTQAAQLAQELSGLIKALPIKQAISLDLAIIEKLRQDNALHSKNYQKAIEQFQTTLNIFKDVTYPSAALAKDKCNVLLWLAEVYRDASEFHPNEKKAFIIASGESLLAAFSLTTLDHLFLPELEAGNYQTDDVKVVFATIGIQNLVRLYDGFAMTFKAEGLIGLASQYAKYAFLIQAEFYSSEHFHYQKTYRFYQSLQTDLESKQNFLPKAAMRDLFPEEILIKQALDKNVATYPTYEAYLERAEFYFKTTRFEAAKQNYEIALQLAASKAINQLEPWLNYSKALCEVDEFDKAIAELMKHKPSEVIFENYKAVFNMALVGSYKLQQQTKIQQLSMKIKDDSSLQDLLPKHRYFCFAFISNIQIESSQLQLPTSAEIKYMVLKAFSHLANIDVSVQVAGTGGSIKLPVGDVLSDLFEIKRSLLEKKRELEIGELNKLATSLVSFLFKIAKALAQEFAWQIANLTETATEKLAAYLAIRLIHNIKDGHIISDETLKSTSDNSLLYLQFLAGIYALLDKNDIMDKRFAKDNIHTKHWTLKGVVEHSGLELDNHYYTRKEKRLDKHKKYHYRYIEQDPKLSYFFKVEKNYQKYETTQKADEDLDKYKNHRCLIQ